MATDSVFGDAWGALEAEKAAMAARLHLPEGHEIIAHDVAHPCDPDLAQYRGVVVRRPDGGEYLRYPSLCGPDAAMRTLPHDWRRYRPMWEEMEDSLSQLPSSGRHVILPAVRVGTESAVAARDDRIRVVYDET